MAVTLEQIARAAGVSKWTVSRVLRGKPKAIWPGMARRAENIRRIARRLGYRPNAAARAVAAGHCGNVGLLMGERQQTSRLTANFLNGVLQALAESNRNLTVTRLADEQLTDPDLRAGLLGTLSVDGLLVNYTHRIPGVLPGLLTRFRLPAIWVNVKRAFDSVYPDEIRAGQLAAQVLLEHGHRRVAFLYTGDVAETGPVLHFSLGDRCRGYEQAMRAAHLEPRTALLPATIRVGQQDPQIDTRVEACAAWLARADRPTAVVSYSSWAGGPLLLAAGRLGLRVPEDLSVVCIGDAMVTVGLPVTTVWHDGHQLGRIAVELLAGKMRQPARRVKSRRLDIMVTHGETVGPPATS